MIVVKLLVQLWQIIMTTYYYKIYVFKVTIVA